MSDEAMLLSRNLIFLFVEFICLAIFKILTTRYSQVARTVFLLLMCRAKGAQSDIQLRFLNLFLDILGVLT